MYHASAQLCAKSMRNTTCSMMKIKAPIIPITRLTAWEKTIMITYSNCVWTELITRIVTMKHHKGSVPSKYRTLRANPSCDTCISGIILPYRLWLCHCCHGYFVHGQINMTSFCLFPQCFLRYSNVFDGRDKEIHEYISKWMYPCHFSYPRV